MKFWHSLSVIGVQSHYDDKLIKRITLTNQFSFIALITVLLSGINNYVVGDAFSAILIELLALICLFGLWLNKIHHHIFATSFILSIMGVATFYFDSYSGFDSGSFLYYFPIILAIGFVFDFKQKKEMLFHFGFVLFLLAINITTHHNLFKNPDLSIESKHQMFIFNLFFSSSSIGFFMYLTISNNIRENTVFEQRINERKATEDAIKEALNEKDILLAEIHHRVKNNLAIITSLFNLQIGSIENEEAKNILLDSKNRVKSMALIHDSLYKSESLSEIDFSKYTKELINEIHYSYPTLANNIKVNTTVSDVTLNVNTAIPCGLILNELLTNSYKHAFNGREKGVIDIIFSKENNTLRLKVKDDGVGLKSGYEDSDSLGLVVVHSLSDQLDGKCKFYVDNGTCFELEFEQHLPMQ